MNSNTVVDYCGWVGYRNIGDEAIYYATQRLFDGLDLRTESDPTEAEVTLIGGGTILPVALKDWSDYDLVRRRCNYALGVGVLDPDFYNRRVGALDLRWAAGQAGVDMNEVLNSLGLVGAGARAANRAMGAPIVLDDYYFPPSSYEAIGSFGFDVLGVRGPHSKTILDRYGIDSTVVGDPALYLEPNEYHDEPSGKIAITVRNPEHTHYRNTKWTQDTSYVSAITDACRRFSDEYQFVIVPFYPADLEYSQSLAGRIPGAEVKDFVSEFSVQDVLDEFATCDLVIGEKLHANVLSACCEVPFVSLEYDPKSADFAASVGLDEFNIRIDRVTADRLTRLIETGLADDGVREQLRDAVNEIRSRLEKQTATIGTDIRDRTG